jgi:hypothetical protein
MNIVKLPNILTLSAFLSFLPYILKYFLQRPLVAAPQVFPECGGHSSTPSQVNKKIIVSL